MAITKVDGVITEGSFIEKDQFERCGVVRDDVFAVVGKDPTKQIAFDTDSMSADSRLTLKGEGDSTLTLVSPGTDGAYIGLREGGAGVTEAYVGTNGGELELYGSDGVQITADGNLSHSQLQMTADDDLGLGRADGSGVVALRASEIRVLGSCLTGGETKASPGTVDVFLAIYSEADDTVYYIPAYASKTS